MGCGAFMGGALIPISDKSIAGEPAATLRALTRTAARATIRSRKGGMTLHSRVRAALVVAACLMATGCILPLKKVAPAGTTVTAEVPKNNGWAALASDADRSRINRTALAWQTGIAEARARGFGEAIRSEGKLLVAGGGLERPAPTPGSYRCRLVTLGRSSGRGPVFERFKPFFC